MEHVGISETRRLQGLGAKQRESLCSRPPPGPDPRRLRPRWGRQRHGHPPPGRSGRQPVAEPVLDDPSPASRRARGRLHLRRPDTSFEARIDAGGFLEWATILGELLRHAHCPRPAAGTTTSCSRSTSKEPARCSQRRPDAYVRAPLRALAEDQEQRLRRARRLRGAHRGAASRSGGARRRRAVELADHVVVNDDLDGGGRRPRGYSGGRSAARSTSRP